MRFGGEKRNTRLGTGFYGVALTELFQVTYESSSCDRPAA